MKLLQLCLAARPWYLHNGTVRLYHSWDHAQEVVASLPDGASPELTLAAYWHDAVYVPGAGSDANERCSAAALARCAIHEDSETQDIVEKAVQLILYTDVETHLNPNTITGDLAALLDADLRSLSLPYDTFIERQKNIITEAGGTYEANHVDSAMFLQKFLEVREFIYHTQFGREIWEKDARRNIARYQTEEA
jgi:predicted metal-dependent HD superfamily phosphohydrolase